MNSTFRVRFIWITQKNMFPSEYVTLIYKILLKPNEYYNPESRDVLFNVSNRTKPLDDVIIGEEVSSGNVLEPT